MKIYYHDSRDRRQPVKGARYFQVRWAPLERGRGWSIGLHCRGRAGLNHEEWYFWRDFDQEDFR